MLGRFLKLTLSRFSKALGQDAYEFLVFSEDKLSNMGLVDTHYFNNTNFC